MNKNRIEGRPRCDERAQHREVGRFSRGGKCGGRAGTQRALTWGGPDGATRRGVSRGRSTGQRAGGGNARLNEETGRLDVGKGQTEQEHFDSVEDVAASEAGKARSR